MHAHIRLFLNTCRISTCLATVVFVSSTTPTLRACVRLLAAYIRWLISKPRLLEKRDRDKGVWSEVGDGETGERRGLIRSNGRFLLKSL